MRLSSRRECRKIGTASSGASEEVTSFRLMYLQYPPHTMLQVHRHLPPLLTIPIKGIGKPLRPQEVEGVEGAEENEDKGVFDPQLISGRGRHHGHYPGSWENS